ncbi:ABC transporter ATP-binding protein [Sedimentibacter sp. zth1]|uniref:ABC transporter ATP-binding protein n=1 Tax=Sedimentibacter sp. zth1 TaxID=2816908 RepID=UPI001A92A0A6|nr:ABC transporter ATP-binding protein [Sedimentibacter sp. zth1]QSX05669.1 ABC transporter ATP-binding protein [Sedimentibacter sp. zth1]
MKTILQAKGLWKEFDGTKILKGIDVTVNEGEFVAIMGQSGSGKSTLLYNISGMDRATNGEISFDGEDISNIDDEKMSNIRLEKMGFIFQQSHLLKTLSIRDNIVLPGFKAKSDSRENVNAYAEELMKRTGIDHIADHDIKKVSGGQLQRAAICRALINHPDIIFGDELTGALNSAATNEIMDIINEVNAEGTTVMLVTHDAKVATRADRVIFLSDGNITDEIFLGKYQEKSFSERESKMTQWIGSQGF